MRKCQSDSCFERETYNQSIYTLNTAFDATHLDARSRHRVVVSRLKRDLTHHQTSSDTREEPRHSRQNRTAPSQLNASRRVCDSSPDRRSYTGAGARVSFSSERKRAWVTLKAGNVQEEEASLFLLYSLKTANYCLCTHTQTHTLLSLRAH